MTIPYQNGLVRGCTLKDGEQEIEARPTEVEQDIVEATDPTAHIIDLNTQTQISHCGHCNVRSMKIDNAAGVKEPTWYCSEGGSELRDTAKTATITTARDHSITGMSCASVATDEQ